MTEQITAIYDIMKAQKMRVPSERHRGEFGVEIETETDKAYDYPQLKFWNTTKDNSLRDWGVEYVLKAPMNIPDLEKALGEFSLCEKKYKFKNGSISTSVHVHVNMLNETYLTLANMITTYALVENILIKYSGPDRISNLFCFPMIDCEGVEASLFSILQNVARGNYNSTKQSVDRVKYGAINPAPLTTLGTIEFRSFRGETNIEIIHDWVSIIKKIKSFSSQDGMTPPKILSLWKECGAGIIDVIFQEYSTQLRKPFLTELKTTKAVNEKISELIMNNVAFAAKFATATKNWDNFGVLKIKPVYKEKIKGVLDDLSMSRFSGPFDSIEYHERLTILEMYHRLNPTSKIVELKEDI